MIQHTAKLPYGYVVFFRFERPVTLTVEWEPEVPLIRNPRARRRFLEAYQRERATFMETIATVLGGNVAAIDLGRGQVEGFHVSAPATRQ